jgi:hypothetical protein
MSLLALLVVSVQPNNAGLSPPPDKDPVGPVQTPLLAHQQPGVAVFQGKFYRMRLPCIHLPDGSWVMPAGDGFEVVRVIRGQLPASLIEVRLFSDKGKAYPENPVPGQVYTLRLTPAERTKQQLRENQTTGRTGLDVDGNEIEHVKE